MANLPHEFTITSGEYRPCMVGEKKALFHRWVANDDILIKFTHFIKDADKDRIMQQIKSYGYMDGRTTAEKITTTYGLIEYEDGRVASVKPELIRFLDGAKRFEEYYWGEEKKEEEDHKINHSILGEAGFFTYEVVSKILRVLRDYSIENGDYDWEHDLHNDIWHFRSYRDDVLCALRFAVAGHTNCCESYDPIKQCYIFRVVPDDKR